MKRTAILVATASLLVAIVAGIVFLRPGQQEPASRLTSSEVDLNALELLAEQSCRCVRDGGSEGPCWQQFRAEKTELETRLYGDGPRPEEGYWATACAPVSTQSDCFFFSDGERCIVTGYDANGVADEDRDVIVCTAGEAQAIEAADRDAWLVDGRRIDLEDEAARADAIKRANAAIDEVMDRIRKGEKFERNPTPDGCV